MAGSDVAVAAAISATPSQTPPVEADKQYLSSSYSMRKARCRRCLRGVSAPPRRFGKAVCGFVTWMVPLDDQCQIFFNMGASLWSKAWLKEPSGTAQSETISQ